MRKATLFTMFVVLAGVFCGGKTGSQANKPAASAAKWPAEATDPLTEDELAQFVIALPAFSAALKAANWTPVLPQDSGGPVATLTSYVEQMNVPGLEEALKPAGSSWGAVRPTLYKVFAALAALNIDAAPPEMVAQMRADTSAGAKKSLEDYEAVKAACSQIPEANQQMVTSHKQELQALQTLGQ